MRRILALLLAASATASPAAVALPAAAAPAAHTGLGISLLDAPANLAKDPRAHVYVIDQVAPGATFVRHVDVFNDSGAPAHVQVYADAATIQDGSFIPMPGQTASPLTSWMSISPQTLDLAQGARQKVAVTFHVPANAPTGENYGVVYAQMTGRAGPGAVAVISRVGIRVYLSIGGGGSTVSNFAIDNLQAERDHVGRPVVQAQVNNTGGRALDMTGTLRLDHGPGGLSAGPFPVKVGTTLAPGQHEPVSVVLDRALPAGPWHARIDLQSDLLKRAAEATLTFPSGNDDKAAPVAAKSVPLTRNRDVLVPIAIGLLLFALLLLLLVWWRRRRHREAAAA